MGCRRVFQGGLNPIVAEEMELVKPPLILSPRSQGVAVSPVTWSLVM